MRTVFYGLSTEGLKLARSLIGKHEVTVIDENLRMAIPLNKKIANLPPRNLIEYDLTPISSFSDSLANAEAIFFAPKIKKIGAEGRAEILIRLKELSRFLPKDVLLFYLLPLPPRGCSNTIMLLEDQSGLKEGEDFYFLYYPLTRQGGVQKFVGVTSPKPLKKAQEVIGKIEPLPFNDAEMKHFKTLLQEAIPDILELSFPGLGGRLVYLSDVVKGLLDIYLLNTSIQTSNPLFHLSSAAIKSIEFYLKSLENYLRRIVKRKGLKAIRTHILILWSLDPYELRGDASRTREVLINKLREAFGVVEVLNDLKSMKPSYVLLERSHIILACTKEDENYVKKYKGAEGQVRISVTSPLSIIE